MDGLTMIYENGSKVQLLDWHVCSFNEYDDSAFSDFTYTQCVHWKKLLFCSEKDERVRGDFKKLIDEISREEHLCMFPHQEEIATAFFNVNDFRRVFFEHHVNMLDCILYAYKRQSYDWDPTSWCGDDDNMLRSDVWRYGKSTHDEEEHISLPFNILSRLIGFPMWDDLELYLKLLKNGKEEWDEWGEFSPDGPFEHRKGAVYFQDQPSQDDSFLSKLIVDGDAIGVKMLIDVIVFAVQKNVAKFLLGLYLPMASRLGNLEIVYLLLSNGAYYYALEDFVGYCNYCPDNTNHLMRMEGLFAEYEDITSCEEIRKLLRIAKCQSGCQMRIAETMSEIQKLGYKLNYPVNTHGEDGHCFRRDFDDDVDEDDMGPWTNWPDQC